MVHGKWRLSPTPCQRVPEQPHDKPTMLADQCPATWPLLQPGQTHGLEQAHILESSLQQHPGTLRRRVRTLSRPQVTTCSWAWAVEAPAGIHLAARMSTSLTWRTSTRAAAPARTPSLASHPVAPAVGCVCPQEQPSLPGDGGELGIRVQGWAGPGCTSVGDWAAAMTAC